MSRVVHWKLDVPFLMHGDQIMGWKVDERSWIKAVQMDNLRGLSVIRWTGKSEDDVDSVKREKQRFRKLNH